MRRAFLVALVACGLCACGGDSAAITQPVALHLQLDSSDLDGGTLVGRENMDDEPGDPYLGFVGTAQARFGGDLPSEVDVVDGTVRLVPGKGTTVSELSQLFAPGQLQVRFVTKLSQTPYPVGSAGVPDAGTVALDTSFSSSGMAGADQTDLLGGNFAVELSGPVNPDFVTASDQAQVEVQLTFAAHR